MPTPMPTMDIRFSAKMLTVVCAAMIAVAVASAAALTLLPALLAAVGKKIDAVRVRRRPAGERDSRLWHRWAVTVMRRPWIALTASLAVLLLLAMPVLHMQLGSSGTAILPSDSEPRVASELVAGAFGLESASPLRNLLKRYTGMRATEIRAGGGLRVVISAFLRPDAFGRGSRSQVAGG